MDQDPDFREALEKLMVMQLLNSGRAMDEVAQELKVDRNQLKSLIRKHFRAAVRTAMGR